MAKRKLFSVITPLGYTVELSRDRWRQITRFKHPAMLGREREVRACLRDPDVIRASVKDPNVHLYYRQQSDAVVCVTTAPTGDGDYFVVTTYITERIKAGQELWKK